VSEIPPSDANVLVFETPWATRATTLVFAVFAGGICLIVSTVAAVAVALAAAQMLAAPQPIAIATGLFAWLIMAWLAWKTITPSLRFRVTLGHDKAEIGTARLRRGLAYCDVEMIILPRERGEYGVRLEGSGRSVSVCLSPSDEVACAAALRQRCANAVFVDHSGREHLPQGANRPLLTLRALYRRCRALAWASLLCSASMTIMIIALAVEVLGGFGGAGPNWAIDERLLALCIIATPVVAYLGLKKWRQARVIREKLSDCGLRDPLGSEPSES